MPFRADGRIIRHWRIERTDRRTDLSQSAVRGGALNYSPGEIRPAQEKGRLSLHPSRGVGRCLGRITSGSQSESAVASAGSVGCWKRGRIGTKSNSKDSLCGGSRVNLRVVEKSALGCGTRRRMRFRCASRLGARFRQSVGFRCSDHRAPDAALERLGLGPKTSGDCFCRPDSRRERQPDSGA